MENKKSTKKMMTINIDEKIYRKLKMIAKIRGTNCSAIINNYIFDYVKENEQLLSEYEEAWFMNKKNDLIKKTNKLNNGRSNTTYHCFL